MEQYTWKHKRIDQNWADHAVAHMCWDMVMNQWSNCFNLLYLIIILLEIELLQRIHILFSSASGKLRKHPTCCFLVMNQCLSIILSHHFTRN